MTAFDCEHCGSGSTTIYQTVSGPCGACRSCGHCWFLQPQTSAETASRPPEDTLVCPKPGCRRPKPFENAGGKLECWWCGHVGSWHDFPPIPNQSRERDTSSEGDGSRLGLYAWLP